MLGNGSHAKLFAIRDQRVTGGIGLTELIAQNGAHGKGIFEAIILVAEHGWQQREMTKT